MVLDNTIPRVNLLATKVIFFLFTLTTYSQFRNDFVFANRFESLSTKQGLSSNKISDIIQDKDGFLWISSHNGLNKYDGYHFETFQYEIDDLTSLSHSDVKDLMIANHGKLWAATWGGSANIFNFEKQTFSKSNNVFNGALKNIHNHIQCMYQVKDGSYWLGTLHGLIHFNPNKGSLESYFSEENNTNSISNN